MRETQSVSTPAVMPVDREKWLQQLNASNFANCYKQYRDVQLCPGAKKILIVGPGQGLDTEVLRWRGYEVVTFDIDTTFKPDVVGSVHDLSMFADDRFDVVIASHVLEHLPVRYLDKSLSELARTSRYALIYLPIAGRHFQWRMKMDVKGLDFSLYFDLFNYFHKPDGETARYCQGQHYWEIGMRGYRLSQIRNRLSKHFQLMHDYRNDDWNVSRNFVLKSIRAQ